MSLRFLKGSSPDLARGGWDAAEHLVREMPSAWLAELVESGGTGPVPVAVARRELDRRGKAAQETLCTFLDRLSTTISREPAELVS